MTPCYLIRWACFVILILCAIIAWNPRFRPTGADLVAFVIAIIGIAYLCPIIG